MLPNNCRSSVRRVAERVAGGDMVSPWSDPAGETRCAAFGSKKVLDRAQMEVPTLDDQRGGLGEHVTREGRYRQGCD